MPQPGYASAVMRRREIERLVCDNLAIPRREARRWLHVPIEQEDLVAEGSVGLVRAAQKFDATRGIPFSAFAVFCVRHAILEVIRARARRHSDHHGGFFDCVSLDERNAIGRPLHDPADPRAETDVLAEDFDQIRLLAGIPANERYALLRTEVDGATAEEVGKELGVGTHRVYVLAAHGSTRLRKRAA